MNKAFIKQLKLKNIAIIFIIAIFFVIDRYLKKLALGLSSNEEFIIIGKVLSFKMTPNYQIAFSLPMPTYIILPITLVIIITLIFIIFKLILKNKNINHEILALTLIVLGAISNLFDRLQFSYVIDYLYLKNFSILNIADIMISLGTIFFIISHYKMNFKKLKRNG
jgi:signal peptidase II